MSMVGTFRQCKSNQLDAYMPSNSQTAIVSYACDQIIFPFCLLNNKPILYRGFKQMVASEGFGFLLKSDRVLSLLSLTFILMRLMIFKEVQRTCRRHLVITNMNPVGKKNRRTDGKYYLLWCVIVWLFVIPVRTKPKCHVSFLHRVPKFVMVLQLRRSILQTSLLFPPLSK